MNYLISKPIETYVHKHTSSVSQLLEELEHETRETTEYPQMLSGKVEGLLLQMLIKISGAQKVVEIGTFTGYSALLMAEGLDEDGELITCEISEEYADIARRYFEKSPHGKKIHLRRAPALETLRRMADSSTDFVFIDADKGSYPLYYEESLRILKTGGLIVADNALWYGRVLSPEDDESRAIASFNETVKNDERVEKVLMTIRDGVYLIRKR